MLAFLTYYKQQSKVVYRKDKLSWPLANRLFLRKPAKTRFWGESKANFTTPCSETKWAIQNSYDFFFLIEKMSLMLITNRCCFFRCIIWLSMENNGKSAKERWLSPPLWLPLMSVTYYPVKKTRQTIDADLPAVIAVLL